MIKALLVGILTGFFVASIIFGVVITKIHQAIPTQDKLPLVDLDSVSVSFYSPSRAETDDHPFEMANGQRVYEGAIAVSRDLLKQVYMGDEVYIKELGFFTVCDLMAKDKVKSMDVFYFSKKRCNRMGRLKVKAYKIERS